MTINSDLKSLTHCNMVFGLISNLAKTRS